MQPSFIQQVEPTEVELSGGKVKLLFSLRAAAEIEDAFQAPYLTIVYEALGMDAQGKTAAPMSLERQARLIQILARAGGQELSLQELMDMHMTDYTALAAGTMREIFMKSPRGGKKKSRPAHKAYGLGRVALYSHARLPALRSGIFLADARAVAHAGTGRAAPWAQAQAL